MEGKLFSQDFLSDGIRSTPVWEALSEPLLTGFIDELNCIYAPLTVSSRLNEANTEADIIEKVLGLLGWKNLTLKQVTASSTRRKDGGIWGQTTITNLMMIHEVSLLHPGRNRGVFL